MNVLLAGIVLLIVVLYLILRGSRFGTQTPRARVREKLRSNWGRVRDRERKIESIAAYHRFLVSSSATAEEVDERTWKDLDFDAVFCRLDRSESTVGQQSLYHQLRTPPDAARLAAFEALVHRMEEDEDARHRAQAALRQLGNPDSYDLWWLTEAEAPDRGPWPSIYGTLAAGMASFVVLSFLWPGFIIAVALGACANLVLRSMANNRVIWILPPFRQVSALLGVGDALKFLGGDEIEPIVRPLHTELPQLRQLRKFSRLVARDPFSMPEIIGTIWMLFNFVFLIDLNAVILGSAELRRRTSSLLGVIAAVGEVDAAISVASFRSGETTWTRPRFVPFGSPTFLADLRHPLIEAPVPNTVELGPPQGILVTGSNMSGKTTLLRTVGVNVILAQAINTCLASAYRGPRLVVESFIGRQDDLLSGKSYYLAEVEAVLARVKDSTSAHQHLFLFDELFRGTNAVERIAAAEAVLIELIVDGGEFKPHFVLAAIHDLELVGLLRHIYSPFHFADAVTPEGLSFDHKLRMGPTSSRNAIELLRVNGAPDALVARAVSRAAALDSQR